MRQEPAGTAMPLFPVDRSRHGPDRRFAQFAGPFRAFQGLSGAPEWQRPNVAGRPPSAGAAAQVPSLHGLVVVIKAEIRLLNGGADVPQPDGCEAIWGSRSESGAAKLAKRIEEFTEPPPRPAHRSG